jgi:hypothetical protein
MIHFSALRAIMERRDSNGDPLPFSLVYVKKSTGEKISIENAVLTSWSHPGNSFNVKLLNSGQVRKLLLTLVTEFNGKSVYI